MIKKTILMLLVLVGGVVSANATRIYVKKASDVTLDRLYVYDADEYGYTSSWGDGNTLTEISNGWYYIDTWKTLESNIKWILYLGSDDRARISGETSFIDIKGKYLNVTSNSSATWETLDYVAFSPTQQSILATMTTTDGITYTCDIDNQTNYINNLDVLFAPAPFLTDMGYSDGLWNQSYRPWNDHSGDKYSTFSDYVCNGEAGIFGGTNNWVLSSPFHYSFTIDLTLNHSGNNGSFSISPSFTSTINAAEINGAYYATFSSNYNVAIPEGVTAYYASAAGNGSVTMTPFENGIESAQGAFLKLPKASDNYTFTPASSTDNITTNYLAKGTSDGVSSSTSGYNYVFARQQGVVGFYKVGTTATGSLEGKAYLHSETSLTTTTAPYLSIELDGETTDIKVIDVDFMQPASNNGATYDLSGRRVENMTKGVYIVNGKKVIVK